MELKITADKKLMEALDKIANALTALNSAALAAGAPVAAPKAEPEELTTHKTEPASEAPAAPENVAPFDVPATPSRDEIQRLAIVKIQAGLGSAVKKLVEKYGAARVSEVALEKLAEFKAELEALV